MFLFSLVTSTVITASSFQQLALPVGLQRESLRLTKTMLVAFALSILEVFLTGVAVAIPMVCAHFVIWILLFWYLLSSLIREKYALVAQ